MNKTPMNKTSIEEKQNKPRERKWHEKQPKQPKANTNAEKRLFGTDGVRGKANKFPMTAGIALKLGQAASLVLSEKSHKNGTKPKFIIGKDTRISGYVFEYALASGLCSTGSDVFLIGPLPTPAIAHLTKSFAADAGIVISASHNPFDDNGIKFFDSRGYKLSDEIEMQIESLVFSGIDDSLFSPKKVGKAYKINDAQGRYIEFAKSTVSNISLKGIKIVLDCANGAAYKVAPLIFSELGAEVITIANKPDGLNINLGCGALYPERLKALVLENKADIGIALDGDADRVIIIDEKGNNIDGDHIMALSAIYMKEKGLLKNNTVVATVMSNLGFELAMKKHGINLIRTNVGDRYVSEALRKGKYSLGGEQSGHIIFSDHTTTGDGTITALQVLRIMKEKAAPLSELANVFVPVPQVLLNAEVREKIPVEEMPSVVKKIKDSEGPDTRILVRYSGTENKLRVMVEGNDTIAITRIAESIIREVKKYTG